jgi:pyrroline-5-carboxylate reductase
LVEYKIGIIGCGNMGEAFLKGLLDSNLLPASQVTGCDISKDRNKYIKDNYKIVISKSIKEIVEKSKYILLSVKPQNINTVLDELKVSLNCKDNIIISIAAGVPTFYIEKRLNLSVQVVRIMPNTPALIKKGMFVVSKGKFVCDRDFLFVIELIKNLGNYVIIDEKNQNIATAISGSGPAYFFLFCKYLIEAGIRNGLSPDVSKKLVINTIIGSGELLKYYNAGIEELIKMVASPGGTTEKALEIFNENKIDGIILKAVSSAVKRAYELQEMLKN